LAAKRIIKRLLKTPKYYRKRQRPLLELRIAGHDVILPAHKEDDVVVAPLINRVHMVDIVRQAIPKRAQLYGILPCPSLLTDPPEILPLQAGLWIRIDSIRIRIRHFCSNRIRIWIQFRIWFRIQAKTELSKTIFFSNFFDIKISKSQIK
jgi:hypothetical protein